MMTNHYLEINGWCYWFIRPNMLNRERAEDRKKKAGERRKKQAEAKVTLKNVRKDLRKEVDQLETRVKWWNIFAMPLAVTTCGILLAVYKRKLTGAK